MDKKQSRIGARLCFFFLCLTIAPILLCSCGPLNETASVKAAFKEANDAFNRGDYQASLHQYERIVEISPTTEDRVLFEMGIINAHPKNAQKDYQKATKYFQQIIKDYPESGYRQDSEMMIFYINNISVKDKMLAKKQTQIETLQQELASKSNDIVTLKNSIEDLEQKIFAFAIKLGPVEKILVEKKERRLMLISNGTVIKTYKIALGGNPTGPKERQGDNKTPEGIYFIDAKNMDSRYYLSLHISYPNEKDKQRAKELGVSPGGDIMIHGIKNGFSWVGDAHTEVDWTKGCIAVTDKEIEEINTFAPIGTTVEIRP
jgi:tetratricopeptide (TPR) repeat protein